jgi:DNA modification methylase
MASVKIFQGDALTELRKLPDASVNCCITSPPYWGLRDYGVAGQLGLEKTPEEYVAKLVVIFGEVRRVLRDDGTLWLNLGDSYCSQGRLHDGRNDNQPNVGASRVWRNGSGRADGIVDERGQRNGNSVPGMKPKDLVGIPWRVAFALQADGWWLRSDIIWHKPNPMPESVTDRPTRAHEYIFLLSKSERYYYDYAAIREAQSPDLIKQIEDGYNGRAIKDYLGASVQDASATKGRIISSYRKRIDKQRGHGRRHAGFNDKWDCLSPEERALCGRNKRDVWSVAPANFKEAHFATFPPDLIKPCILAGCPIGGTVLDPLFGSGTTGMVALELGRSAIGIELNPEYVELAQNRCNVTPGLQLA